MEEVQIGDANFKVFLIPKSFKESIDKCVSLNSNLGDINFIKNKQVYKRLLEKTKKHGIYLLRAASANENASCFELVDFTAVYPDFKTFTICKQDNDFKQNLPFICFKENGSNYDSNYVETFTGLDKWTIFWVSLFCSLIIVVICCVLATLYKRDQEDLMLQMNEIRREIKAVSYYQNMYKPK